MRNHQEYDAFGVRTATNAAFADRYGYTGREHQKDSGLLHHRHRWYDPRIGRWVSEDPIEFAAGDGNLYRYVGNNATNATDPDGLQAKKTAKQYKDEALGLLGKYDPKTPAHLIARNNTITKLYAQMYRTAKDKQTVILWAGLAAAASSGVGQAMIQANRGRLGLGKADFALLAEGDLAVFQDIYWQHLVFKEEGVAGIERLKRDIPPLAYEGWKKINEGLTELNKPGGNKAKGNDLIWEGSAKLLEHEQRTVLQPIWRKDAKAAKRLTELTESPVPLTRRKDPENIGFKAAVLGGNIGSEADRWKWISNNVLPSYRRWFEKDPKNAAQWMDTWRKHGSVTIGWIVEKD